MCHFKREYWELLDKELREDETPRTFEVIDERDVPEPDVDPEPERELEREPVRV